MGQQWHVWYAHLWLNVYVTKQLSLRAICAQREYSRMREPAAQAAIGFTGAALVMQGVVVRRSSARRPLVGKHAKTGQYAVAAAIACCE